MDGFAVLHFLKVQGAEAGPKGRGASGEQLAFAVLFAGWREEG